MQNQWFKYEWFKASEYPYNFIPKGSKIIIGVDYAKDGDCTVKGFYQDGEYHIQSIEFTNSPDKETSHQ